MCTKFYISLVFLCLLSVGCEKNKTKYKRKVDFSSYRTNKISLTFRNNDTKVDSRGFLPHSSILSWGKVINFFPVGGERECQPSIFTFARAGICLNPYDCRQRDGKASGDCAHGLGVCCVFEVSCGGTAQNNLTYFMSPGFPELWTDPSTCDLRIEKSHAGIIQLRIDFVHFTIGQPNRITGECDEDAMVLGEGPANFTLCGQNHGQHIYYTLESGTETRESGELPSARSTPLSVRMRGGDMPRLWLLRIAQLPLAQAAPHGCLQYHTADNGTIKTFNYASNGRHLASQDYKACIRKNAGFCAIRYSPCDRRSFRIGPGENGPSDPSVDMDMMPSDDVQNDEQEGSGSDPQIIDSGSTSSATNAVSRGWPWGAWARWSPYVQHYNAAKLQYYGSGTYGLPGFGRLQCTDRVTIPCENEYFVSSRVWGAGVCDPHHCGSSFCPGEPAPRCRVFSSITPFAVSVHFGPPTRKRNPEDNIGMCLQYTQISCNT